MSILSLSLENKFLVRKGEDKFLASPCSKNAVFKKLIENFDSSCTFSIPKGKKKKKSNFKM